MENSQAGIAIADSPSGTLLYVNKAGLSIRNKNSNEIVKDVDVNKYVASWQILHFDGTPYNVDEVPLARAVLYGETNSGEFIVRRDNNEDRYVWANAAPVINETGNQIAAIVVFLDITEKKQTEFSLLQKNIELQKAKEKAEESDKLKTAFLQNVSHEIRTPMNAIMGFSELITRNYNNKQKLDRFSEIIKVRCDDLLGIVNDLLDIAKIESGQISLNIEECHVKELFTEIFLFFNENKKQEGRQNIKFIMHIPDELSEFIINTDKIKLKQILVNLISNAFKFTQTGEIKFGCTRDEYNNILFYVSDTGIGIAEDKKTIIFERFTQLENDTNRIYGGTGLGLSIVNGLVNKLGGKIWFESELNKGSTFYFTISYLITDTFKREKTLEAFAIKSDFSNKSVLIVEDDTYNTEYIKELLTGTGLNILETSFGFEAIKICQTNSIDIVLMDIGLPDINGYELIKQIKKFQPSLRIIAQTAYASSDEKQTAIDFGCVDYISKPLKSDLFLTMILKHLS